MATEIKLYERVSLLRDVPEKNLKRGTVGTLIDYIPHPGDGEIGCVLEVFNVLGESIEVVVVPRSDIDELQENEVFLAIRREAPRSIVEQ